MDEIKVDKVFRSDRKTLALQVTPEAGLIVRAPRKMPLHAIKQFIEEQSCWIRQKQEMMREKQQSVRPRMFESGENFYYLGTPYPFELIEEESSGLVFDGTFRLNRDEAGRARELFVRWYREAARPVISDRVAHHASKHGLRYERIKINGARTRWGSCSAKGDLNFSWRLVMAPLKIIDYVVVHELAHTREKNHSRQFWEEVKRMDPDYLQDRHWLKDNGYLLVI